MSKIRGLRGSFTCQTRICTASKKTNWIALVFSIDAISQLQRLLIVIGVQRQHNSKREGQNSIEQLGQVWRDGLSSWD